MEARAQQGEEPAKPEYWGGYALEPTLIEFWQGGQSRLHDRFMYELQEDDQWSVNRFYP